MSFFSLDKISKSFGGQDVFAELDLHLERGKVYALFGDNGTGKTTLLNSINGQLPIEGGEIFLEGKSIKHLSIHRRAELGILRLWQHAKLFKNMNVLDNLLVVRPSRGESLLNYFIPKRIALEEEENVKKAKEVLLKLELDGKENNLAKELSFGQQRLLAFGRILMASGAATIEKQPKSKSFLILVDEPFAGIHQSLIEKISEILLELARQGSTVLMIEHNIEQSVSFADHVLVLEGGWIKEVKK